ncbi:methylenetetrahydrofolate reductase [NAD(P)H] [Bifidobacterium vespertilionis]|uniref:Methylenetetrahydrofolate reductase n=1 Tax=Bifidobacterium vespertilionis TaxID=2562524 RepID=A0A5J5DT21_9BIFI|nr:methylenetetrahydrofolate reductase [NAD(P)H] [Bifidobacterium vespertilionis]KAA8818195.1 methylenetetrahydrofolate reductase [NAD(P)H] [Bifidobacterium vespertilionis]KAA8822396.1 methylenetetrahydrofolate reductase [NAD(P)H] [Bifidobacterium vespertilionis]
MTTPMFSLEVFPPKRNAPVGTIYDTLDGLEGLKPDFISVTYGHGTASDRTATARIAHTIRTEYGIPTVAHLTALYSDHEVIDHALEMFDEAGVQAVLALRGDYLPDQEPVGAFPHASDLVAYIREKRPDLKIFGACYPEGHYQAESLDEDIANLKKKVDAGASHLISQLFYDDDDFYRFLDKARAAGIDVPIEAGIMPVRGAKSVRRMAERNASRIPAKLNRILDKWADNPEALRAAGINYASDQITDLVAHGVDGIHLYTMNHPGGTRRIWQNVGCLFAR